MSDPYRLPEGNTVITCSGGRTSAFMLHEIIRANGRKPFIDGRARVIFTNTGKEAPETLKFIKDIETHFDILITWLEYRRLDQPDGKFKHGWERVTHNSASRQGEPFAALIEARKFLPNPVTRYCTQELKVRVIKKFCKEHLGWQHWTSALGIRADEAYRGKQPQREIWSNWFPLINAQITKRDVAAFWAEQPFDLHLPNINGSTPAGNCDLCFLKSEATLAGLIREKPELADWWIEQEQKTSATFRKGRDLKEFADFIDRQADFAFDDDTGLFCQAGGGACEPI